MKAGSVFPPTQGEALEPRPYLVLLSQPVFLNPTQAHRSRPYIFSPKKNVYLNKIQDRYNHRMYENILKGKSID